MAWGAIIGAAASLAGTAMSNKRSKKNAKGAEFKPSNVTGIGGTASYNYDPTTRRYNAFLTPDELGLGLHTSLRERAAEGINGGQYGDLASGLQDMSGNSIGGLFEDYQDIETMGGISGLMTALQMSQLGDQSTSQGLEAFSRLGQSPSGMGLIQDVQQRAGGLMDMSGTPSFNQLAAERLGSLRGMAKPMEERLVNSKFSDLFSQGRLGTTGGAQILGDLESALGREDMARVVSSQDFAQNQVNVANQFALNKAGMGSNLFGMALQGIGQEQGNSMNFGNLGSQLMQLALQSRAGTNAAVSDSDNAFLSRGQNRLMAAQGMFGFGDALKGAELERALASLGGSQTIDQTLMDQARIGGSLGTAQATAGANAAALRPGSTLGSALQGFGAGVSNGGNNNSSLSQLFSNMFSNNRPAPQASNANQSFSYFNPNLANGRG